MGRRPDSLTDQLIGTFSRNAQGNGFVRLKNVVTAEDRPLSVFIPAEASRDASTGDIVAIKLGKRSGPYGRREGRILEIVERETNQFVGAYFEENPPVARKIIGKAIDAARAREAARKAKDLGISAIVFDRGGNLYHGRVQAVAEGAREGGLQF